MSLTSLDPLIALMSDTCVSVPLTWASLVPPFLHGYNPDSSSRVPDGPSIICLWITAPRSSGLYTCFFFHLQNCKSNKSFNTLSQRSSAFPTSTCLFPLICPVTVVRGGWGSTLQNVNEPDPLVLYVVTAAVDVVWPPSLGLFSLLYWLPVSVSRTDSLRCFNIKMLDGEKWKSETDLQGGGLEGL